MDTFKKIIVILVAASVIPVVLYFSQRKKEKIPPSILYDAGTITRYEERQRSDTVYKFMDRIVYRDLKPDVVYVQKTDTVFADKVLRYDLPLRIDKSGDELGVTAFSIKDSALKEYIFKNTSPDFILTAKEGSLNLKSNNFCFEKPCLSLRTIYLPGNGKALYEISSETGVSFRNKLWLTAGCGYETGSKSFFLSLSIKMRGL